VVEEEAAGGKKRRWRGGRRRRRQGEREPMGRVVGMRGRKQIIAGDPLFF
jgi:hypothetical protein